MNGIKFPSPVLSDKNVQKMSTILHELIHWRDVYEYKRKFSDITDFGKYIEYLNKNFAPKFEKLQNKGYNIDKISNYAYSKLYSIPQQLDEVYTEYRVKKYLEG